MSDDLTTLRYAVVVGETDANRVAAYMPANYSVERGENIGIDGDLIIVGTDVAGWTLDGYVIPRLASGLIMVKEIESPADELARLEIEFEANGGRGVELAERIDALRAEVTT